jgi:hypothetical protein
VDADGWAVLGTVASIASLALAVVQTIRYRVAKSLLRQLRNKEQVATWSHYDLIVQAYDWNAEARDALRSEAGAPIVALEKTAQVSSLLNAMWLKSVEHAASLEINFDEEAIERWQALGRLDTEWRLKRARKLLPSPGEEVLS